MLLESFVPAQAVDVFARLGVTTIGGGPAFYRAFVDQQRARGGPSILPALRFISGGGAPMPPELHCEVRDEIGGMGCANGFGMTEGVIMAINDPRDTDEHLMSTSGRALDGMEIRAVDASGAPLPPDTEGELQIRGVGPLPGVPRREPQRRRVRPTTAGSAPATSGVSMPTATSPSPGA